MSTYRVFSTNFSEWYDFSATICKNKYSMEGRESWEQIVDRTVDSVMRPYVGAGIAGGAMEAFRRKMYDRKIMPGGRYLYASGRPYHQVNNCFLFRAEDSRVGWGRLMSDITNSLMTGGGVGVVYSDLRGEDSYIHGMGGRSTGPIALMNMVNEAARHIIQGGSRRSALWAGLHWWHPDIFRFITLKNWNVLFRNGKREDANFPCPMDGTNISVILDTAFFEAFNTPGWSREYKLGRNTFTVTHDHAVLVYWTTLKQALSTAEPGFSIDAWEHEGENLRNACTEITSFTDGDMCNLVSANMARIESLDEFEECVDLSIQFQLCGSLYSDLPVQSMHKVRNENRRLGLGLMGVHEWLMQHGVSYGPTDELARWMERYAQSGDRANYHADRLGISRPLATRGIAPTGTISIVAQTTSAFEPMFSAAYARRYLHGQDWYTKYVIDPCARRMVEAGYDPEVLEDAMTLSEDVERRVGFQAWMQGYVDHAISSTINLPSWGSSVNNEGTVVPTGNMLLKYLPKLRGLTFYPDGARDGQPITRIPYLEALNRASEPEVPDDDPACRGGMCNS